MNVKQPPLDNVKVREAVRWSIDYDGIIRSLLRGGARKVQTIVPEGLFGFNSSAPFQQDISKAKALLAEAGVGGGFTVEMLVPTGPAPGGPKWADIAAKIQSDLAKAGIKGAFCGGTESTPTSPEVLARLAAGMQSGDRARAIRTGWEVNVSQAMAADADAYERFTGIVAPDQKVTEFLKERRGLNSADVSRMMAGIASDPDAEYAHVIELNAEDIYPMVATPGDPAPISESGSSAGDSTPRRTGVFARRRFVVIAPPFPEPEHRTIAWAPHAPGPAA